MANATTLFAHRVFVGAIYTVMSLSPSSAADSAAFELSPAGYIRYWLVAGPQETPYSGPPGEDHVLRHNALDYGLAVPPASAALGEPGPFGKKWQFHDPGHNEFVEFSMTHPKLTVLDYYAFTEIEAAEAGEREARFWAAGAADLWVNGEHIARLNITRYRNPDSQPVTLPLKKGINRLCVRLQCLGMRDTRVLFGLSLQNPKGISVRLPGAPNIARAENWLYQIKGKNNAALESAEPAPFAASVKVMPGKTFSWPAGASSAPFGETRPFAVEVEVAVDGTTLERRLEFPHNRPSPPPIKGDRREAFLRFIAKAGVAGEAPPAWNAGAMSLMARRLLNEKTDQDAEDFKKAIEAVDARRDCADFVLSGLLRLELLKLTTKEESAEIRRAALAFRYWLDEPGNDAMCFTSENHTLLFHGCQLLAGQLYPKDVFTNSVRTGEEQARLAAPLIWKWLEKIEARGFEEFNSSTYIPITTAAMLNVVDFANDPELSRRMAAQVDRIFEMLAIHEFDGGIISPQGRVYRDVLFPDTAGTQVLLSSVIDVPASDLAGPRPERGWGGDWTVFPLSSPRYRTPDDLLDRARGTVSETYRSADAQIVLEKTPAYILTSLAIPAVPREGEHPDNDLRPGGAGYQQHLWQATLGRDCHVFVNHPGGFYDETKSRPGYWYGSGLLPRVRQEGNWLQAIHVISDGTKTKPPITSDVWQWGSGSTVRPYDLYPVAFTHAHWPSDSFDREVRSGNWIFGQKGRGLIGLWCSEPLAPHDDMLTGRELRANSYASAWLVVCGDLEKEESLEAFMQHCKDREPAFDRTKYTLGMKGASTTRWWERPEPMPE